MEFKQIKELMATMGKTGIKKLSVKQENFELQLEHGSEEEVIRVLNSTSGFEERHLHEDRILKKDLAFTRAGSSSLVPSSSSKSPSLVEEKEKDAVGKFIKSPMVGTFYGSPSPDDPPFIKVGDVISEDTVVCIIEAMKVMNEIKAGMSGTVKEVLVESSHPVEFGTSLYKIV